jgi:uncharacterized membrane protein YfcA
LTLGLAVTLALIGAVGALLSGMLGIGGAIVNYPMLLYIPTGLGLAHYTPHEVSGIVSLQVFFSTLSGVIALRKERMIHRRLVLYMGTAVLLGSFAGSYGARYLSSAAVNMVFAGLATIAAVMMFIPARGVEETGTTDVPFNRAVAAVSAAGVGIAAGIVGAGGAFLLVPIMLQVLKIPTRLTIASSLAITWISSIGTVVGKVLAGHVPYFAALVVVVSSVLAAPLGVRLSRRVNPKILRVLMGLLIMLTAVKIWTEILA